MPQEVELKLEIDPSDATKLRSLSILAGSSSVERQISVYYDTPKGRLRRQGFILRVRQHDEGWTQTVKRAAGDGGLLSRDEWESQVQGLQPDLNAIAVTPLGELIKPRQVQHLVPIFQTDVERISWRVGDGAVELSYDSGTIEAGERSEPVHELELELKNGEVEQLFTIAKRIARDVPVRVGVQSKSERGFALAAGTKEASSKAPPVAIDHQASVADGFGQVAASCLRHFRLNEPLLLQHRDPEAMHQLRVAIRRLRTALWLFRPAINDEERSAINDQLRRLTRELGVARNIDVILASMGAGDPARAHLERERERLYARIIRMFDTRRFRQFMLDLLGWVEVGDWRRRKKARMPMARFAARRLDRLWQVIAERGAELKSLSEDERHQLRIDAKKMRYALEFLGGIGSVNADDRRQFIAAAEGVQDSLGHLNDLATRRAMLSWPLEDSQQEVGRCLRTAKRHLRTMEKIGPFWRQAVP